VQNEIPEVLKFIKQLKSRFYSVSFDNAIIKFLSKRKKIKEDFGNIKKGFKEGNYYLSG